MRVQRLPTLVVALLLTAILPFASDASSPIPVPPASAAACCNVVDRAPPPTPDGDEQFFRIPGGVPNVMMLLDTSGSMFDLPRDVTYPAWSSDSTYRGSCSGHWLNAPLRQPDGTYAAVTLTDTPFDNGYSTASMTDSPPWGLARCTAKQARPAGDKAQDWCQFRGDSYYKHRNQNFNTAPVLIDDASTYVYNAHPCAAIDGSGNLITDYYGNPVQANNLTECQTCLATAGFYVMNPRYQSSKTGYASAGNQVVYSGKFLNAYPPKFVAARKVVKDLVKIDPTTPQPFDPVRFGLTVFNGSSYGGFATSMQSGDGGKLVVPLGPNCDQSYPPTTPPSASMVTARQAIVDAVNKIDTSWNPTLVNFGGNTPLAESLFNVGQYFSNTGASSVYGSLFGSGWVRTSFNENASGTAAVSWTSGNQHSFCWACQQSSIVVVTDGAPNADNDLPKSGTTTAHSTFDNDFRFWSNSTVDCPTCQCDLSYGGSSCNLASPVPDSGTSPTKIPNMLHKVAKFLHDTDLRPDLANGAGRVQNVSTYTVSFGLNDNTATNTADDRAALAVLQKTADLGGGKFQNSSSGAELATAVAAAVSDVVKKTTSFSSANVSSLQVSQTVSADAFLGRFRPTNSSMWEGHLFASEVFDEFGQGCDSRFSTANQKTFACGKYASRNPNLDGDEGSDGKAICTSAFLIDRDCDPIVESSSGGFKKATVDGTTHQLVMTPDDAVLFWDAGQVLSSDTTTPGYRSADENDLTYHRAIYTTLDTTGDGKFTPADGQFADGTRKGLVEFTGANAAAIAPLMNLPVTSANPADWTCTKWLGDIGVCGGAPLPACPASATDLRTLCAQQIIYFYRGWDVTDLDGDHCAGPGNYYNTHGWGSCTTDTQCGAEAACSSGKCVNTKCSANGEQRDRARDSRAVNSQEFWKLGDIFHSSPVLVKPPIDKLVCSYGADNQCVLTLYSGLGKAASTATPLAKSGTLDAYDVWRNANLSRPRVVLVGANDGMLHAFDAGVPDSSKPPQPDGTPVFTNGTGAELWAYIPPDLLPMLRFGVSAHQYYVDGNTMVRDVWVDANKDGIKQANEFHTVAVITERGGGSRYTALDVTDPTKPSFLWTFPPPCSEDSKLVGQTWSDFMPRPPPIGAVRLANSASGPADPLGRGFEERWVVFLNGGWDPALVRGRAVWMLDVWTGQKVWQYTDADFKAMRGNTTASMFPVAASIGMVDLGAATTKTGTYDTDAFFDTATWGDVGGNLFVARFNDPGKLDSTTGMVTNWTAARAFETKRQTNDTQLARDRGSFFFMTSNFLDGASHLTTHVGTTNRERMLKANLTCGPDNVLGCCQAGCTVTSSVSTSTYGAGSCSMGGTFQCSGGTLGYTPAASTNCSGAFACTAFDSKVTLTFDCGAAGKPGAMTAELTCDSTGACTTDTQFSRNAEISTDALGVGAPRYHFYGIWAYGGVPTRTFNTPATAKTFDANRATDVTYSGCVDMPSSSCTLVATESASVKDATATCLSGAAKCSATQDDPGWQYTYGLYCPTGSCSPSTWSDEKTGNGATVMRRCVSWAGFRPTGAVATDDPCTSSVGAPSALEYSVDARTGVPRKDCGVADLEGGVTTYYPAVMKDAFAPPQTATQRVVVNAQGQVNYSTFKVDPGSPPSKSNRGTRSNISESLYWLEVPRQLHTCRHVDPTTCQ